MEFMLEPEHAAQNVEWIGYPMPYDGACDMEVELAIGLREAGYGVWQA